MKNIIKEGILDSGESRAGTPGRSIYRYTESEEASVVVANVDLHGKWGSRRGHGDVPAQGYTASLHLGELLFRRCPGDKLVLEVCGPGCLKGTSDGAEEGVKYFAGLCHSLRVNRRFLAFVKSGGCRAVQETKLCVIPHRLNMINAVWHANTSAATGEFPILSPVDAELAEYSVDCSYELVHLLHSVTGSHSDA